MSTLITAIGKTMSDSAPTALDAVVKAFGDADCEEQAAFLSELAGALLESCATGGGRWERQVDEIAELLSTAGQGVFLRLGESTLPRPERRS